MPAGRTWLTGAMCIGSQESCCCTPKAHHPQSGDSLQTLTKSGDVFAVETDPKARQAFLYNLDSLVVGAPASKVELSRDEVAALEGEAQRALNASYGEACSQIVCPEASMKSDVPIARAHVIVSRWHLQLSYGRLQFAEDGGLVRRPQFVSAFPAALAAVDPELPTSLRFRVAALPQSGTSISVGFSKWPGFKSYFGQGFGKEEHSWGLQWKAADGEPVDPDVCSVRLSENDVVCLSCDSRRGCATISLNGIEAANYFLPCGEAFVLGATLSTLSVLRIIPD